MRRVPPEYIALADNYSKVTGKKRIDFFREVQQQEEFHKAYQKILKNGNRR